MNLVKRKPSIIQSNNGANLFDIRKFYLPRQQLSWNYYRRFVDDTDSRVVWEQPDFSLFRKFALLPAIYSVDNSETEVCFWYMDLRFYIPTLNTPFRYGMCRKHAHTIWKLYRIKLSATSERQLVNIPIL